MTLLRQFDSYRMVHVYREVNKVADRLADRGTDDAVGKKQHGLKWIKRSRSRFGAGEESPDSTGQGGR